MGVPALNQLLLIRVTAMATQALVVHATRDQAVQLMMVRAVRHIPVLVALATRDLAVLNIPVQAAQLIMARVVLDIRDQAVQLMMVRAVRHIPVLVALVTRDLAGPVMRAQEGALNHAQRYADSLHLAV
jgi:hypothetical protein